jgi:hypothetical protein
MTLSATGFLAIAALAVSSGTSTFNQVQIAAGNGYYWLARSAILSPSDGVIELTNQANTDFGRLQLGGTTSSFPAIKRSSATIAFRLADDSADCFITARFAPRVTTAADATSITPATDAADITYQSNSQAGGTLTINADSGTPVNGQKWILKLKCTNIQTLNAWNAVYVGGTVALPAATTGGGKIDYFAFIYDSVNSKWQFTGNALGF